MDLLITTWEYLLVLILAAIPWIEVLVVIPMALAYGLAPFWVALLAFTGNFLAILFIIFAYEGVMAWWKRKEQAKAVTEGYNSSEFEGDPFPSRAEKRAARIWETYGLPGLALVAPVITGIHLAVVLALTLKCSLRSTAFWMTISLALWSAGLTLASFYGLEGLEWLRGGFKAGEPL